MPCPWLLNQISDCCNTVPVRLPSGPRWGIGRVTWRRQSQPFCRSSSWSHSPWWRPARRPRWASTAREFPWRCVKRKCWISAKFRVYVNSVFLYFCLLSLSRQAEYKGFHWNFKNILKIFNVVKTVWFCIWIINYQVVIFLLYNICMPKQFWKIMNNILSLLLSGDCRLELGMRTLWYALRRRMKPVSSRRRTKR